MGKHTVRNFLFAGSGSLNSVLSELGGSVRSMWAARPPPGAFPLPCLPAVALLSQALPHLSDHFPVSGGSFCCCCPLSTTYPEFYTPLWMPILGPPRLFAPRITLKMAFTDCGRRCLRREKVTHKAAYAVWSHWGKWEKNEGIKRYLQGMTTMLTPDGW